jgi:hypothetical protein
MANKTMDEQIRLHAYYLWEADGRPEGRSHDYWQKARTLLEKHHAASAAPIDQASAVEVIVEMAAKKPSKSKTAAATLGKKGVKTTKTSGKDAAKPSKETSAKAAGKPKSVAKANDKPAKKKAAGKSAAGKAAPTTAAAKPAARAAAKSKSIDKDR